MKSKSTQVQVRVTRLLLLLSSRTFVTVLLLLTSSYTILLVDSSEEVCVNQDGSLCTTADTDSSDSTMKRSAEYILKNKLPFLLYGTAWKKDRTSELVQQAIHAGFRFIDTACQPKHYNESGVGIGWTTAATELQLQRHDFFIQTKFTSINGQDPNRIPYDTSVSLEEQVQQSLQVSLRNLQTTYLDSLVIHGPEDTIEDTMRVYRTMESFVKDGTVHRIGISNCYDYNEFVTIYEQATIKPSVLQNRFYADSNFDTKLRQFCKDNNIWYQSFWTLTANWDALISQPVQELAQQQSITSQMLLFAYLLQLGYVTPLSGTTNINHMQNDISIMERIQSGELIFKSNDEMYQFEQLLGIPS